MPRELTHLPGWEIVSAGLADLAAGSTTAEALLVASASERLGRIGLHVPSERPVDAPARLYELLVAEVGEGAAHGRYNALRRRLASFLRAAELGTAEHAPAD